MDVNTFSSLSYFYILNLLLRVDFAFSDDLLFSISYRMIFPNEGKYDDDFAVVFLYINFYFSNGFSSSDMS
jgi:hypothetical protein